MKQVISDLIEFIDKNSLLELDFVSAKKKISQEKQKLAKKYNIQILTDIQILLNMNWDQVQMYKKILMTKPTRSISGVAVIAIMTNPAKCPHGKCIFCPGGLDSFYGDVPQSYTGKEPATLRGIRSNYNAYFQVMSRLEQYIMTGHVPDKVELIVMGGTFPARDKKYQEEFIGDALQAMNDFSNSFFSDSGEFYYEDFKTFFLLPGDINSEERRKEIQNRLTTLKVDKHLNQIQTENETSRIKCVGLTVETRPDYGYTKHGKELLKLGVTRIELGIQCLEDNVLKFTERGHGVDEIIKSTKELKDLGFKLNYHYMIGLPGMTKEKDISNLTKLFDNPNFRPDMLKIYPTMVMPGTKLQKLYEKGEYTSLKTEDIIEIITELKKIIPKYCRIMRIQRDIPSEQAITGQFPNNLREQINTQCNCIRCREIGRHPKEQNKIPILDVLEYQASDGKEFFISYETENALFGFCRLRITKNALVRELHVYGTTTSIGETGTIQHQGLGTQLLIKAEKIAKDNCMKKMFIISGIGVRKYYEKFNYSLEGPYMVKTL